MGNIDGNTRYTILCVILLAFLCGCASPPPPPNSIAPLDTSKLTAVKAGLNTDPDVASQRLDVSVINDEVTLSGTVPNEEIKKKAEELAARTHGITKVTNNIKVVPDSQ
ncbi:MAG: BON domain-containing protein [Candidatus Xenobiia bacterium LiM19]